CSNPAGRPRRGCGAAAQNGGKASCRFINGGASGCFGLKRAGCCCDSLCTINDLVSSWIMSTMESVEENEQQLSLRVTAGRKLCFGRWRLVTSGGKLPKRHCVIPNR